MESKELIAMLNAYFNWNKSRMSCFVGMLASLIKVRTVNLTEIACGFQSQANLDSRYKRLKRFFKDFSIDFSIVAAWIIYFFDLNEESLLLTMDRTNWQWGTKNINILMLSIVYQGIAIPLYWRLLPKRGNSNTTERIEIIERCIQQLDISKITGLLADREFVGNEWFSWLLRVGIHFCIRIKSNCITTNSRGLETTIDALFYDLKPGEQRILQDKGAGEYAPYEKRRFYRIAKRSATECTSILDICQRLELIERAKILKARDLLFRIVSMLIRMVKPKN
jgi:23S rRNA-intervening sequence protein